MLCERGGDGERFLELWQAQRTVEGERGPHAGCSRRRQGPGRRADEDGVAEPVRVEDAEMNLEEHYDRERVDHARDHCVVTVRAVLRHRRIPAEPLPDEASARVA